VRVENQHVVTKGENLGKIAGHYGLTVRELVGLQAGKLRTQLEKNPHSLWVGTKLRILVEKQVLEVYKPPAEDVGRLPVGVKLKPRPGVLIKRDHLVWGTKATIRALEKAIKTYYRRKPGGPKIRVGDISKKGGGALRGHLSHQRGVDVDIGIVHKGSKRNAERFTHATSENLDVARTWALLKAIIDTQAVRVVFLDYALQKRLYQYARKQGVSENTLDELLQYPRGRGRAFGIVRHWRSHRGHLHVRFRR
ncbi:MAG: penicillin-insensitive murein endopeptidase, partial [Nannocystaceae bacterium]